MISPSVHIRPEQPADAEAIAAIMNCPGVVAGTLQLPWTPSEQWRERMAQRPAGTHSLVAELDGRVVGTLGLHVETRPRRNHTGSIGMAVHDQARGRGVGTALMVAVIELSDRWLNLRRLELTVYVDNAPAIHLYQRFGFEIEGTARDYAFRDGAFVDAYSMARINATSR
ncbi:MAG TPA: GNAT family N-acetyltransferase [Thermomicrobiales bacterium]|nr:GNAT family N-acetyltransferase [Thermomicrobiales bacterium]